jgi:hypothetical protein
VGEDRDKSKIKDTRTTRFEDRYNNRSLATTPKMLVGIAYVMNKSATVWKIPL